MTAPTERNPAAVETAGLEIAIQRQPLTGDAQESAKITTAAGAVEKAAPIPSDVLALATTIANEMRQANTFYGAEQRIARAIMQDRAGRYDAFALNPKEGYTHAEVEGLLYELSIRFRRAHTEHVMQDRADRASQEERIREDERDALFLAAERAQRRHIRSWIGMRGGMFPADRARLRGDAS